LMLGVAKSASVEGCLLINFFANEQNRTAREFWRFHAGSITGPTRHLPVTESVALPPDPGMHHMPQSHMRPEPSLIPVERPRCPRCQNRMMFAFIMPGPPGYDVRNFECVKCAHIETRMICKDPMKAGSAGWANSDLNPPK
jgi:hypothetical protein